MNALEAAPKPRVTVVMAPRERNGLAEVAIESVIALTPQPFRFIYLDIRSPDHVRAMLAERGHEWQLEVRRFDEALWPQQARARIVAEIDSEFVVFIDNDVVVSAGWLDQLLRCAEETGAGVVGPLYLWGDGRSRPTVHMAGGRLDDRIEPEGRVLEESHESINADPVAIAAQMQRRPCGFVEFHCMLVRRSLFDEGVALDPAIHCVHEHIDLALQVRERGYEVVFEPAAVVTYLAFAPFALDDLPMLRWRWGTAAAEASIAAFCRKWNMPDDERSFWGVRTFLQRHVAGIDAIRPASLSATDLDLPMQRDELCQSRSDLLDLAQYRGSSDDELNSLADAFERAQMLANAGYRPCGRPFLNHLVGTAGVLLRYGFRAETVAAGMLHAAYTHCPPINGGAPAAVAQIEALLAGRNSPIERRVRAYTQRELVSTVMQDDQVQHVPMSVFDAEILAIAAANEIDMHLSGEVRYTGRADLVASRDVQRIERACLVLGVSGLFKTLQQAQQSQTAAHPQWQSGVRASYRIGGRTPGRISMLSDAPHALGQPER
jgi:GT2 family glycosyltransferase